ncbi:MAG: extracellular protein, partial [uncultured bacterium]
EQLAMKEVMSNPYPDPDPTKGFTVLSEKGFKMTDPRWPAEEGWEKVSKEINTVRLGGEKIKIEIHYLWNKTLNIYDDFKFKS